MASYIGLTGVLLVSGTLCASGVSHLTHLKAFAAVLKTQLRLSPLIGHALGIGLAIGELAIAVLCMMPLLGGPPGNYGLRGAGLLFLAMALYQLWLVRARPGAPCGCGVASTRPANVWVVVRVAILGVWSAAAGAMPPLELTVTAGIELAFCAIGAWAVGMVLWVLPDALHIPSFARADPA